MAWVGFLQLDENAVLGYVPDIFPQDAALLIKNFIRDLSGAQSRGLLSTGLFFAVYNTTNGFRAVINATNRAYGVNDSRGFLRRVGMSFVLMVLFTFSLLCMMGVLVFGAEVWAFFFPGAPGFIFNTVRISGALVLLVILTSHIYKLSCAKKIALHYMLPGAVFTVAGWAVSSAVFGYLITNFTQYPTIYGSIAGVFILVLWLNLICVILLIGNECNALLYGTRLYKATAIHQNGTARL
jgi:membrane protein